MLKESRVSCPRFFFGVARRARGGYGIDMVKSNIDALPPALWQLESARGA